MDKPIVLVLDNANSARSQIAEAFIRKYGSQRYLVYSAGTLSKGIHPLTAKVMGEKDIDISTQWSKSVREYLGVLPVSYLIILTQSAEEHAPSAWPNIMGRLEWPTEDPTLEQGSEEEQLDRFRKVRDQLEARVKEWLGI